VKRPLKPDELKVWGMVAATVHPMSGRKAPSEAAIPASGRDPHETPARIPPPARGNRPPPMRPSLDLIEPNRRQRIAREREEIGARLDLHGLDQQRAQGVLEAFVRKAWDEGYRAVLVITGKGVQGDGVLKRRAPEWLAAPHLAQIVAGISNAARHHGGDGALYVALKRKPKP